MIRQLLLPVLLLAAFASLSAALRGDTDHGHPMYDAFQKATSTMPEGDRLLIEKGIQQSRADTFAALDQHLAEQQQQKHRRDSRSLQDAYMPTRSCGEVIATATVEEISAMVEGYVQVLFPNPEEAALASVARTTLFANLKYNIQAVKVCMSCAEAKASGFLTDDQISSEDRFGFGKYCAETAYGYEAVRSRIIRRETIFVVVTVCCWELLQWPPRTSVERESRQEPGRGLIIYFH